jgi:hypothetical protein
MFQQTIFIFLTYIFAIGVLIVVASLDNKKNMRKFADKIIEYNQNIINLIKSK